MTFSLRFDANRQAKPPESYFEVGGKRAISILAAHPL
jgi:hypothetical protein